MANIKIDINRPIANGSEITFLSPCSCSIVDKLNIYHPDEDNKKINSIFAFKDAHGNDLSKADLFAEGVYVKVLLNTVDNVAYIQNADTNKYLEDKFKELGDKIDNHNTDEESHNDIRLLIENLGKKLNTLTDGDDVTLDQISEIVAYIKSNRSLIESITTGKINVADIVDNLTTDASDKPLSAKQGTVLKGLIDMIVVPTLLSQLAEDETHRLVTDVEKQTWNNKSNFSGRYEDLSGKPGIPSKVSDLINDSGFLDKMPTAEEVGADAKGTADNKVSAHNTGTDAHNDIRLLIDGLNSRLNALANSTDEDLDQMAEIVAYIKSNKYLIENITTGKVSVTDIINNLTTNVSNKPLSSAQGVVLKGLIDAIVVPTLLSHLGEDATHRTVTDTEKQTWNNKSNFSGNYNDLTNKPTIPSKTSQLTNDSGFAKQTDVDNLSKEIVDQKEVTDGLAVEKVDYSLLFDYESSNYADMSALKTGMIHTDGKIYTGGSYDSYCYFENYIPVTEGDIVSTQWTYSTGRYWSVTNEGTDGRYARITAYDENKNLLSENSVNGTSSNAIKSYTVPSGVAFVRLTYFKSFVDKVTDIAVVKNATKPMPYVEFGASAITTIKKQYIPNNASTIYVSMPDYVNVLVGNELKIYYRNIFSRKDAVLWIDYHSKLTTRYYDEYISITATADGTHSLPWKVYDEAGNLLDEGTLSVVAITKVPIETTKAIVIGDSTVNAGTMTAKVISLYEANGATLMCLGTRGGATHEGRGGWTAKMYCTVASSGGIDNPFYNNGFDFSYYMANQNYSGVQAVAIQLGINDIFTFKDTAYDSSLVIGYINQMVDSILAYDSTIKVIINLPTTPNSNGTSFTETYGTEQLYWIYNRNIIRFAEELKDYYANNGSVTVSASNCILDTKTQIRDGVHPTEDGYKTLGQRLYEVLVSITDGGVYVAPLLDFLQRAYVAHTADTIATTDTRELDSAKCYNATYNGTRSQIVSSRLTYTPLSANSFSLLLSAGGSSGYVVEFPLPQLEVGKTYTLQYTADVANQRVYLIKYNSDTTYNTNTLLASGAGNKSVTITPEEGYIYSIGFALLTNNVTGTYSNVSLTES